MTVPGVYSPEQGGKDIGEIAMANMVERAGNAGRVDIGITSAAAVQAHVDKVIASDGVDDDRAVEVMARAICIATGLRWEDQDNALTSGSGGHEEQESYRDQARAALGALRALEGE